MDKTCVDIKHLEKQAFMIRSHIINTIVKNGEGHAGSALSCSDILSVLYFGILKVDPRNPKWEGRDRFLLSGGHKCLGLYAALLERGFITDEILNTYNKLGTAVPGHPDMKKLDGVDFSTGSLGHGLPVGSGMALAGKLSGKNYRVYVLMGDGEQGEGSVWEAAGFAAHKKLDNLVGIIDRNGLQINGTTKEVLDTSDLADRYSAFGWSVKAVDGHCIKSVYEALSSVPFEKGKPSMILANTVKGKGLSFAENNYKYHHWNPDREEAEKALAELKVQETYFD